jgi:mono/diheme cytochrome c family protein
VKSRRRLWPGIVVGALLALVIVAIVLAPLALTHRGAGSLEMAYGNTVVNAVTRVRAMGVGANPVAGDAQAIQTGREAYTGSCAQCHGAAGDGKGVFGQVTFPPATDFTSQAAKELSDQQMFYIIKNGLGFTAMPAYAGQYSDADIWTFVSFIRELQKSDLKAFAEVPASRDQLRFANLQSSEAAQRGAAVYFAQGCAVCHGALGQAPEQLNFDVNSPDTPKTIRDGTKGMPRYGPTQVSDAQMQDLLAYLATFPIEDEPD